MGSEEARFPVVSLQEEDTPNGYGSEPENETEASLDWRHKRLSERLGHALENDEYHKDVIFVVGPEKVQIPAHKLILRLSSIVFEDIITAHENEGMAEIQLPNTDPKMFWKLLKFIYTDELELKNLLPFLKVAEGFGFQKLSGLVAKALKRIKLDEENAVYLFDVGKGLKDKELEYKGLSYILNNGKKVLRSRSFGELSYSGLCQILLEDKLSVGDELEVFHATLRWAENCCKKNSISITSENVQKVLGEARLFVRYTQLQYEDVLNEVKPSGILKNEEFIQVLKYFADQTVNNLGLMTKPRAVLPSNSTKQLLRHHIHQENENDISPPKQPKFSDSYGNPMPPPEENVVEEFRMFSTIIDFKELLESVQLRYTVKHIILHDVILQNVEFCKGVRAHLPNLETFYYFIQRDDPSVCVPAPLPDKTFMCGLTTKEFLFFEKDVDKPWELRDLWSLNINILIHVKGLRLIEIDHQVKRLTMSFPLPNATAELLQGLKKETDLKHVCITACNLAKVEDLYTGLYVDEIFAGTVTKLTTLVLQGVEFRSSESATKFINQFPNLKILSLYLINSFGIDFETELQQRATLEQLTLSKVNLSTYKKKKGVVPFVKCEELYLDVCTWPPAFGDHFSALFPKLQKLVIRSKGHCRCTARLFTEMLEIQSLKSIALFKYPGGEDPGFNNPNINIFLPPGGVNKAAVKNFLTKVGVPLSDPEVPDFVLEKNSHTKNWKLVPDVDCQQGSIIYEQLHFERSMLDRFFDDVYTTNLVQ